MKSHVSDQLVLAKLVLDDAFAKCTAVGSNLRDWIYIQSRVKNEGISFLTITLPSFASDFEKSLADGYVDSNSFRPFGKNGAIPAFLQGMTSQVFDRESGRIKDDACDSIYNTAASFTSVRTDFSTLVGQVRQICRLFNKLKIDCAPERVTAALNSFVSIEHELSVDQISSADREVFSRVTRVMWDNPLGGVKPPGDFVPRHGPGVTADGLSGNRKYNWRIWHDRLEPYFPLLGTAYSNIDRSTVEELKQVAVVSQEEESPVKVTPVPKTAKGPRIIASEPCCMQYAQQSVKDELVDLLESDALTAGHINFDDQSINRRLALMASKDGSFATIDLSDASDRVTYDLAIDMFGAHPDIRDAVIACRSTSAKLPDGRIVRPLVKFASMGSALCFPVEAMYFYTICVIALLESRRLPVSFESVQRVSREIYVYGDDIIVPASDAVAVSDHLRKYKCKVNIRKSFWTGKFRESCGLDAYNGEEVTPTYIRHLRPTGRQQAQEIVSWMATARLFYMKGYWSTSSYMLQVCERYLGKLPYVTDNSPALGRPSFRQYRSIDRWNDRLHRFEVKAWTAEPAYRTDKLVGNAALTKALLMLEYRKIPEPFTEKLHLERSARFGAVTLKRRWVPAI